MTQASKLVISHDPIKSQIQFTKNDHEKAIHEQMKLQMLLLMMYQKRVALIATLEEEKVFLILLYLGYNMNRRVISFVVVIALLKRDEKLTSSLLNRRATIIFHFLSQGRCRC